MEPIKTSSDDIAAKCCRIGECDNKNAIEEQTETETNKTRSEEERKRVNSSRFYLMSHFR